MFLLLSTPLAFGWRDPPEAATPAPDEGLWVVCLVRTRPRCVLRLRLPSWASSDSDIVLVVVIVMFVMKREGEGVVSQRAKVVECCFASWGNFNYNSHRVGRLWKL